MHPQAFFCRGSKPGDVVFVFFDFAWVKFDEELLCNFARRTGLRSGRVKRRKFLGVEDADAVGFMK